MTYAQRMALRKLLLAVVQAVAALRIAGYKLTAIGLELAVAEIKNHFPEVA